MLKQDEPLADSVMGCIFGVGAPTRHYGPLIKPLLEKPKSKWGDDECIMYSTGGVGIPGNVFHTDR